jgi:hypothetical protein
MESRIRLQFEIAVLIFSAAKDTDNDSFALYGQMIFQLQNQQSIQ